MESTRGEGRAVWETKKWGRLGFLFGALRLINNICIILFYHLILILEKFILYILEEF
jgi:hypothetical protein